MHLEKKSCDSLVFYDLSEMTILSIQRFFLWSLLPDEPIRFCMRDISSAGHRFGKLLARIFERICVVIKTRLGPSSIVAAT